MANMRNSNCSKDKEATARIYDTYVDLDSSKLVRAQLRVKEGKKGGIIFYGLRLDGKQQ